MVDEANVEITGRPDIIRLSCVAACQTVGQILVKQEGVLVKQGGVVA